MKAKRRTLYLIWCRDNNTEEEKGIQIWDVANWFIEDKLNIYHKDLRVEEKYLFMM